MATTTSFAEKLLQQIQQLQWDYVDPDTTWAKILYAFTPEQHDELAVAEDQYVQLMTEPQTDWTFCRAMEQDGGKMGYVPTQFFEVLEGGNLPPDLTAKIADLRLESSSSSPSFGVEIELGDNDYEDDFSESTSFTSTTNTASVLIGDSHYEDEDEDDSTYMDSISVLGSDDDDDDDDVFDMDNDMNSSAEEISPRQSHSPRERPIRTRDEEERKRRRKKEIERERRREARKTLGLNSHFRHVTTTSELQELHRQANEHHKEREEEEDEGESDIEQDDSANLVTSTSSASSVATVDKRQAVVNEIVSTEQYYVDCLNIFDEHYIAPMRVLNTSKDTSVLENRDFDLCFKPISIIKMVNTELLSCLQKIQRGEVIDPESKFPVQTIGQLFIKTCPLLKMYHVYVNSYDSIAKRVKYLTMHSERFSTFITNANKKVRHDSKLTLWDLMIAPVQRLPRYNLLLRELMKHTEDGSEEREDLSKACSLMEGITAHINDNVRELENSKRMATLSRVINWRSFSEPLIQSHRKLITEGTLKKIIHSDRAGMRTSKRNIFLFNDLLLVCNKNNYSYHVKFTETPLPWIMDKPNTRLFELVTSTKNILLKAHTVEEKDIWVKDITGCLQKQITSHPELKSAPRARYDKMRSSTSLTNLANASRNSLKRKNTVKQLRSPRKKDRSGTSQRTRVEDFVSDSESTTSTISPLTSPLTSPRQQGMITMSGVRIPVVPRNVETSDSASSSPMSSPFSSPRSETTYNGPPPSSKAAKLLGLPTERECRSQDSMPSKHSMQRTRASSLPPFKPPLPSSKPSKSETLGQSRRPGHQLGTHFAVDKSELSKILERRRLASEPGNDHR